MKGLLTQNQKRAFALAIVLALAVALLASSSGVAASNTSTPAHAKLLLRKSEFGKVIFDSNGNVVYTFGRDKTTTSTCYGVCAAAWPPVLTKGAARVGSGLNASLLGTTKRKDGSLQVTYNHHPLYFYSADKRGKIMCQHAVMHGGIWLVLKANGTPNMMKGKMRM